MRSRIFAILLASALAEASLILPVILLVPTPLRELNDELALAVAWLLVFAIALTRRLLGQRDADWRAQRIGMGAWLIGMLVLCIGWLWWSARLGAALDRETMVLQLIAALLIWWRGSTLGGSDLLPDDARLRLQLGLLLFTVVALFTVFSNSGYLLGFIVPFLFGALFAMPLSHLQHVAQSESGHAVPMDWAWWRTLGAASAVPVLVGMLLASLVSGDVMVFGLRLLIGLILLPVLLLAALLAELLTWLLRTLGIRSTGLSGLNFNMGQLQPGLPNNDPATVAGAPLPPIFGYIAVFAIIIGAVILVLLLMDRRRRETALAYNELSQSLNPLAPPDPLQDAAKALFNTLNLRRWLAALTIRRIYARMGHQASKNGFARSPHQTPSDYLTQLQKAFPNTPNEARLITDAYIAAHYGEVPDTDAALQEIKQAWERVKSSKS